MSKLSQTERRRIAYEYETRKSRNETVLDIALRWRVHPVYVSMIARKQRSGVYAAQEVARRKRERKTDRMLKSLRTAQKQASERRKKRAALHEAILRDYARGAPIAEIARKYNCHESYPAKLAARRGLTRRAIGRPKPKPKPVRAKRRSTRARRTRA